MTDNKKHESEDGIYTCELSAEDISGNEVSVIFDPLRLPHSNTDRAGEGDERIEQIRERANQSSPSGVYAVSDRAYLLAKLDEAREENTNLKTLVATVQCEKQDLSTQLEAAKQRVAELEEILGDEIDRAPLNPARMGE